MKEKGLGRHRRIPGQDREGQAVRKWKKITADGDMYTFWMPFKNGGTFDIQNACKTTAVFKNKADAENFCRLYSDGTEEIVPVAITRQEKP